MRKNYLMYLTIPTLTSIIYLLFFTLYAIISSKSFQVDHILSGVSLCIIFILPSIFIPTLIFSIAYQLTKLTLKNIAYAFCICLMIFFIGSISHIYIFDYINSLKTNNPYNSYIDLIYVFSHIFNHSIIILTITGISYAYSKIIKSVIHPINNKVIALLYSGLFVTLCIFTIYFMIYYVNLLPNIGDFNLLSILQILIIFIMLVIYFIYTYEWTKRILDSNNINAINYPIKIIFSFVLATLIMIGISSVISLFLQLVISTERTLNNLKPFIFFSALMGYILFIPIFIKLSKLSHSIIYKRAHKAYYIISTFTMITCFIIGLLGTSHLEVSYFFLSLFAICGILLLGLSCQLCFAYLSNKIAIRFIFKNNTNVSIKN